MKKIFRNYICLIITVIMLLLETGAFATRVTDNPVVFIIGDSTACKYKKTELQTGWAQVFHNFFDDPYMINDCAVGGASSRSFYNNYWESVKSQIKEGDYVLIQFGHNDCKGENGVTDENEDINPDAITTDRYANPDADETVENSFKWYLKKYTEEITAIGATPVFVTSIERRMHAYYEEEKSRLYKWVTSMRDYAAKNNIAIIDIWGDIRAEILSDYPDRTVYHPWYTSYTDAEKGDNTHLTIEGAMAVSKLISTKLAASDIPLKDYLKSDLENIVCQDPPIKIAEDFEDAPEEIFKPESKYNGWSAKGEIIEDTSPYIQIKRDDVNNKVLNFYRDGSLNANKDADIIQFQYCFDDLIGADDTGTIDETERYLKLKYSFRPNIIATNLNVFIGGIGIIKLDTEKNKVRHGKTASPTKITYEAGKWYETEIYVNLEEGVFSVFVNGIPYFKDILAAGNTASYIQFYPDKYSDVSKTRNLNYDYDIDDISFCAIDSATYQEEVSRIMKATDVVISDGYLTSVNIWGNLTPADKPKFIATVYSADENGSKDMIKGISFLSPDDINQWILTLENPISISSGDIISVYFWDMNTLMPISNAFETTVE